MYLGLDFGTSGCRAAVIDEQKTIIAEVSHSLPEPHLVNGRIEQKSDIWLPGLDKLFRQLARQLDLTCIKRLAIDGTSGSLLLCDGEGHALTPALMYDDASSQQAVKTIKQHCPHNRHITMSAGSGLAKAIQLLQPFSTIGRVRHLKILNQADFLSNYLCGQWGFSDYHNALKLGYDVQEMQWPKWIQQLFSQPCLPRVLKPGQVIDCIQPTLAHQYGFSPQLQICAGSTDANASFIATLSTETGDAVTSLGSTLVLKILNDHPVEDLQSGVYSHKLGNRWLTGGASNAGARILKKYFTDQQLIDYSMQINHRQTTGFEYYPLLTAGERFPDYDPNKQPLITPRPDSDVIFLQALLESLSNIEKTGYDKLISLGATKPSAIQTTGGGAKNPQWTAMRYQMLGIPITRAEHTEACYGSALLAKQGLEAYSQ